VDRCHGRVNAQESPLGWLPDTDKFDLHGLSDLTREHLERLQAIHPEEWRRELMMQEETFLKLYSHLPKELIFQRELLTARL
jgi:phosphoenolpyruvate carboxykinase (GTP)